MSMPESEQAQPVGVTKERAAIALRVRRQLDFASDPLDFARTLLPHHFKLPVGARWHEPTLRWLCGVARVGEFTPGVLDSLPVKPHAPISPAENPGTPAEPHKQVAIAIPDAPQSRQDTPGDTNGSKTTSAITSRRWLALGAPRGHAKSTLASLVLPLWSVGLNRKHFILLLSNTFNQAVKFLQAIKHEWETNRELQQTYPELSPNEDKWADSDIELLRNGVPSHKLIALGAGAQLRGLKFLQHRPDLIVLDDCEDDEMVRSDLRRATFQEWFDNVVLKVDPQTDLVMIGTVIHELSLLNRVLRQHDPADKLRYQEFERRLFVALDHGVSTWPQRETTEQLLMQREVNPYSFAQEKQNEPVDPSYCPFKSEFFTEHRFWNALPKHLSISITIDPAWTIRDYSKETALVCAGWDGKGRLWVLEDHHGKYDDPSLILDLILDWYARWNKNEQVHPDQRFFCVGFDAVSAQKMLLTSFRDRCRQRNLHPVLRDLKADRDKIRRIWQLEPLFRQDRIFLKPDMLYLQHQLQGFPRNVQGGLVDVADALAYHLQLETYRPSVSDEEDEASAKRSNRITFEEYARMHEDHSAYRRAFPDQDMLEMFGHADGRLLAEFVRSAR